MARIETQESISAWAEEAFGKAGSNARIAGRANEEMAELICAATSDRPARELIEEAADITIILYRLAERNGFDLDAAIDAKMALNRMREWKRDGTGHGYHIEPGVLKQEDEPAVYQWRPRHDHRWVTSDKLSCIDLQNHPDFEVRKLYTRSDSADLDKERP